MELWYSLSCTEVFLGELTPGFGSCWPSAGLWCSYPQGLSQRCDNCFARLSKEPGSSALRMQPHLTIVRWSFSLGWFLSTVTGVLVRWGGHRDCNDKWTSQGTSQDCWQSPPKKPTAALGNKLQPDPGSSTITWAIFSWLEGRHQVLARAVHIGQQDCHLGAVEAKIP